MEDWATLQMMLVIYLQSQVCGSKTTTEMSGFMIKKMDMVSNSPGTLNFLMLMRVKKKFPQTMFLLGYANTNSKLCAMLHSRIVYADISTSSLYSSCWLHGIYTCGAHSLGKKYHLSCATTAEMFVEEHTIWFLYEIQNSTSCGNRIRQHYIT